MLKLKILKIFYNHNFLFQNYIPDRYKLLSTPYVSSKNYILPYFHFMETDFLDCLHFKSI